MSLSLLKAIPFITFTLDNFFLVSNEGVKRDIIHLEMKKKMDESKVTELFFLPLTFFILSRLFLGKHFINISKNLFD